MAPVDVSDRMIFRPVEEPTADDKRSHLITALVISRVQLDARARPVASTCHPANSIKAAVPRICAFEIIIKGDMLDISFAHSLSEGLHTREPFPLLDERAALVA